MYTSVSLLDVTIPSVLNGYMPIYTHVSLLGVTIPSALYRNMPIYTHVSLLDVTIPSVFSWTDDNIHIRFTTSCHNPKCVKWTLANIYGTVVDGDFLINQHVYKLSVERSHSKCLLSTFVRQVAVVSSPVISAIQQRKKPNSGKDDMCRRIPFRHK